MMRDFCFFAAGGYHILPAIQKGWLLLRLGPNRKLMPDLPFIAL
jgi:hypothetical protein